MNGLHLGLGDKTICAVGANLVTTTTFGLDYYLSLSGIDRSRAFSYILALRDSITAHSFFPRALNPYANSYLVRFGSDWAMAPVPHFTNMKAFIPVSIHPMKRQGLIDESDKPQVVPGGGSRRLYGSFVSRELEIFSRLMDTCGIGEGINE